MRRAINLAKYIVDKCMTDEKPISNLQLQKILYSIQKAFVQVGKMAYFDDTEAWQFGPVVPNVYYYFCGYGSMPITSKYNISLEEYDENEISIINKIIEEKRELAPWDLVTETHKQGGAWDETYCDGIGNRSVIDIEKIKEKG